MKATKYNVRIARLRGNAGFLGVLTCLALLASSNGCAPGMADQHLDSEYGVRTGLQADSVNGTAVFARMFEKAGHQVTTWRTLSPHLNRADCIVWFPDDFEPPSNEVCNWLQEWLSKKPGRTLIYVGRDFDAATWYWKQVAADTPADLKELVKTQQSSAQSSFESERSQVSAKSDCLWFSIDPNAKPRKVRTLDVSQWAGDIDAKKLDIELNGRMTPSDDLDFDIILSSGQAMLIGREKIADSELLLVANGSFLLNAMLVNHEHRKLASKLIDEVGATKRNVVFLESGQLWQIESDRETSKQKSNQKTKSWIPDASPPNEPRDHVRDVPIRNNDPTPSTPTGFEIFQLWPTNWILLHFVAIGIIFCFSKLPIFGPPRPPESPGTSEFANHVDAVAGILRRSQDRDFANARIAYYQHTVKKVE